MEAVNKGHANQQAHGAAAPQQQHAVGNQSQSNNIPNFVRGGNGVNDYGSNNLVGTEQ